MDQSNKIAICILAHSDRDHLVKLINQLYEIFDLFVHIDKKSNINTKDLPKSTSIKYFKKFNVEWGGDSQVFTEMFILREAIAKRYTHYLLISGQDYPIKSNIEINTFLIANKDKSFLSNSPLPIKGWKFNGGLDRIDRYWYLSIKNRFVAKVLNRLLLYIQIALFINRKTTSQMLFYGGSNWKNICHEHLDFVFDYIDTNPSYIKNLRHTRATDEIWMQTILKNSIYSDFIINNDLRYIDWKSGPTYPKIITVNDFQKMKDSDALFARKFNSNQNSKLFNSMLDILTSGSLVQIFDDK